jgi:hypothetical protein
VPVFLAIFRTQFSYGPDRFIGKAYSRSLDEGVGRISAALLHAVARDEDAPRSSRVRVDVRAVGGAVLRGYLVDIAPGTPSG